MCLGISHIFWGKYESEWKKNWSNTFVLPAFKTQVDLSLGLPVHLLHKIEKKILLMAKSVKPMLPKPAIKDSKPYSSQPQTLNRPFIATKLYAKSSKL